MDIDASKTSSQYGRWLSSPKPGEEVVISGMSGRLPESKNLEQFKYNLMNKVEMVTKTDRRWISDHPELPKRNGKIFDVDKFDGGFFGMHYREANILDPMTRIFLETAIECLMDAGINPHDLEGTRTGVFTSSSWSDSETVTLSTITEPGSFAITGYAKSLTAQRVSFLLKLKGPSYIVDAACSSSMNALNQAFMAIRNGQCDSAIVGGSNLLLHPGYTIQFRRLGVLSKDGYCKVFDQDADGYARADTMACIFLQKGKDAQRIYAQIIHSKIGSDGYKDAGITFPSTRDQQQLLTEIYKEAQIHPSELSYLEAHGTGTSVGDPLEVNAIDNALAIHRKKPLLIGSVKCTIGHAEPSSGVGAVIKVLLAMETNLISPNINLKKLKAGIKGFEEGRINVVTDLTELDRDDAIIGINNFGFGGNNAHVILKRVNRPKEKVSIDVPILVCGSGRTEQAVLEIFESVEKHLDMEHIALIHRIFKQNIKTHIYRGYVIVGSNTNSKSTALYFEPNILTYLYIGHYHNSYKTLGKYLANFALYKRCLSEINEILQEKLNLTVENIIEESSKKHMVLGSICIQLTLLNILKAIKLKIDLVLGIPEQNLLLDYFNGRASLKEIVLRACEMNELYANHQYENNLISNGFGTNKFDSKNCLLLNISDAHYSHNDLLFIDDGKVQFLETLGRLYECGQDIQIYKLYKPPNFPVRRGTPMISPSILWNHSKHWHTYKFNGFKSSNSEIEEYSLSFVDDEFNFIEGHNIDGRNLFPATEYLRLVWETFAQIFRFMTENLAVVFRNCRFIRAISKPKSGFLKLIVLIQRGSGNFEILHKNSLLVTGNISICSDPSKELSDLPILDFTETNPTEVLESDEIYRELYLRGYNYAGLFKGIQKTNTDFTRGLLKWENNFTTFMDTMLQFRILQMDSRMLFVPVGIEKIVIDVKKHLELMKQLGDAPSVPIVTDRHANIIKSGGIEIWGINAKSILKRKPRLSPVLEKNIFIPNKASLSLPEAVRVVTQIILENVLQGSLKAVEIVEDSDEAKYLLPLFCKVLDDIPIVTPDLTISTKKELKAIPGVKVEPVVLTTDSNLSLITGMRILSRPQVFKNYVQFISKTGYILSREQLDFVPDNIDGIEIVTEFTVGNEKIFLVHNRKMDSLENAKVVSIASDDFKWIQELQAALKANGDIILYNNGKSQNGILGLVNCLRREINGDRIKCFFIKDSAPNFNLKLEFYAQQLKKNLAFNVYENKTWGTYRHLTLEPHTSNQCEHVYVKQMTKGDISSLTWVEGPLKKESLLEKDEFLVSNCFCALNFRDIMRASGRVNIEAFVFNRFQEDVSLGFEYAGIDLSGRRVMGMGKGKDCSNFSVGDRFFFWEIPDSWSFEDAATAPIVYATVLYSLIEVADIKPGNSILIHSATGGVGIAAIHVCLHYNCDIYVTVGTQEKREFLQKHFPQISNRHIGNSRDTSFREMIKKETGNKGVDIVLNSLTEEKLEASVKCLAKHGKFLEIGKYDLANNFQLKMILLERDVTYHSIGLDRIFTFPYEKKIRLTKIIRNAIKEGYVKPLPRTVFSSNEIEKACRYMMTGKHIGKVLIKITNEPNVSKDVLPTALTRFHCDPEMSYIVIGGLGGVGLELTDWLILRGAKTIILVSRKGVQTGYQQQRLRLWKSYGVNVRVFTYNVTTEYGCKQIITEAEKLASLDGIFNLGVILNDALFEDQTEDNFSAVFGPKALATKHFDVISRRICPKLRYFVVFSSVSCGRGNAGQTNYGMANSVMERICEERKKDGFPALAIQWGAIGDVGLVAKMQKQNKELVIGGTLQQRISSCLEVLDNMLNHEYAIVSSMVVARKRNRGQGADSAAEAVAAILGIKDLRTVSPHVTLPELGMDSMMGTEIIQVLEKFDIYLTSKEMRNLTFAKLSEIEMEKPNSQEGLIKRIQLGTDLLLQNIPDSTCTSPVTKLKGDQSKPRNKVFIFPGLEGIFTPLEPVYNVIKANIYGVHYNNVFRENTIEEIATHVLENLRPHLDEAKTFTFIGYSYGAVVGLQVANMLEKENYSGKIILLDGSPSYIAASLRHFIPQTTEEEFQTAVVIKFMTILLPIEKVLERKDKFSKCKNIEEKVDMAKSLLPKDLPNLDQLRQEPVIALYKRLKALINYKIESLNIKSDTYLFKAKQPMVEHEQDYQLGNICEKEVHVQTIDGDHISMLTKPELLNLIADM